MSDVGESPVVEALLLDLVEWVARRPRRYDDVMEAWRTSCPRLPVWEEAVSRGLVTVGRTEAVVRATASGDALLRRSGRAAGCGLH